MLSGSLTIKLDASEVTLGPGQLYVELKGTPHQPRPDRGAEVILLEPRTTVPRLSTPASARSAPAAT